MTLQKRVDEFWQLSGSVPDPLVEWKVNRTRKVEQECYHDAECASTDILAIAADFPSRLSHRVSDCMHTRRSLLLHPGTKEELAASSRAWNGSFVNFGGEDGVTAGSAQGPDVSSTSRSSDTLSLAFGVLQPPRTVRVMGCGLLYRGSPTPGRRGAAME